MLDEASALISADAQQLKLNINSYLRSIEGNVALMFANDEFIKYDSSTSTLDDYDNIRIKTAIADRIVDLGVLENYSDFCVVYANDDTVGWKSKTTQSMFSDGGIYSSMASFISDNQTQDGWVFGVQDNFDRMYYVKRYNPNAIIVASFFTRELERTFEYPEELEGMIVRLVDDKGYIVYSSDTEEIGQSVNESEKEYISRKSDFSAVTDTNLINVDFCNNGWAVMCIVSRATIMQQFTELRQFSYVFSAIIMILVSVILIIVVRRLSKPMDGYVDDLSEKASIDMLSDVLNRRAYEEQVSAVLNAGEYEEAVFIMLDMDNFKSINDTLGHDYGDAVIARMGALIKRIMVQTDDSKVLVGRIGGDEFTAFMSFSSKGKKNDVSVILDRLIHEFDEEFSSEREKLALSISAGAVMNYETEPNYHSMYSAADKALYFSKGNGKHQFNFYEKAGDADET